MCIFSAGVLQGPLQRLACRWCSRSGNRMRFAQSRASKRGSPLGGNTANECIQGVLPTAVYVQIEIIVTA